MGEKRTTYRILVWKEKRPLGRSKYKWENDIKNGSYKIEWKGLS
jgi:hypothetical protein